MELVFLGTSAGCPTLKRNVQSVGLKTEKGAVLLFDCGEGTQHQLLKKPLKPSRISAIYLTHLHGDHCFGLPGLLCFLDATGRGPPIEIVGPRGLCAWVRCALTISRTELERGYRVTELVGGPDDEIGYSWCPPPHASERGYETIERDGDGWLVGLCPEYAVRAAHVDHGGIPCVAYRIDEAPKRSKILADVVEARVGDRGERKKVFEALVAAGRAVLSDNSTLEEADVFEGGKMTTRGRSVVIFGDCRRSRREAALRLAADADLVVHEATLDDDESAKAFERGHSTPKDAGILARDARVSTLVMWHFSPRYKDETEWQARFREQARACGGESPFQGQIVLAHDLMRLPINK